MGFYYNTKYNGFIIGFERMGDYTKESYSNSTIVKVFNEIFKGSNYPIAN